MQIKEFVALRLQMYKAERRLSLIELSEELGIAKSSLQGYLRGTENLRSDTIEQLAGGMGLSLTELFTPPSCGWEEARDVLRAARLLGELPPEKQEEGIRLLLALAALFAE